MSEFINTLDKYNERDVEDALLDGTLTEFFDNRLTKVRASTFGSTNITAVKLPLLTELMSNMFGETALQSFCSQAKVGFNGVFESAQKVERIHLMSPQGLNGAYVFSQCISLSILILSDKHNFCVLGYNPVTYSFKNTPIVNGTGYVYVRKKFLEEYKAATNWSVIASQIRAIEDYPEIQAIVDADLAEMRGETT